MSETPPKPLAIKFPVRAAGGPTLALPRRRPALELSAASVETRKQIAQIISSTRQPFGEPKTLNTTQVGALEQTLRQLEAKLAEREHALQDAETRLVERERDLAEMEALLAARETVILASRRQAPARELVSREEQEALTQLKATLDQQEASLKEQKAALAERERFMEENEARLFEKMMEQQEKETELEQREEDLRTRSKEFREKMAAIDPAAAAAFKEEPAKKVDEFNE